MGPDNSPPQIVPLNSNNKKGPDTIVHLSVHLYVAEVHWRIIANLGFKFRSHFTRIAAAVLLAGTVLLAVLLAGGSSRAMLASARLSCFSTRSDLLKGADLAPPPLGTVGTGRLRRGPVVGIILLVV